MSYRRVIPRDLFNEADLLKMYGKLWIALDDLHTHMATLDEGDGSPFEIQQDPADGSLSIANLEFRIAGSIWRLKRPLNTRQPWSLWVFDDETEERVFTMGGALSPEFRRLIGAET